MPESGIATLTSVAGLDVTLSEGVLSVTIDRPDSLNSVTTPVLAGIADAMEQAATDPRVKVVRLRGAGRGFCSGAGMSADDVAGGGPGSEIIGEANPRHPGHHRAAAARRRRRPRAGSRCRRLPRLGVRSRIGF
jgi:enoyl-CoA hydratase